MKQIELCKSLSIEIIFCPVETLAPGRFILTCSIHFLCLTVLMKAVMDFW